MGCAELVSFPERLSESLGLDGFIFRKPFFKLALKKQAMDGQGRACTGKASAGKAWERRRCPFAPNGGASLARVCFLEPIKVNLRLGFWEGWLMSSIPFRTQS